MKHFVIPTLYANGLCLFHYYWYDTRYQVLFYAQWFLVPGLSRLPSRTSEASRPEINCSRGRSWHTKNAIISYKCYRPRYMSSTNETTVTLCRTNSYVQQHEWEERNNTRSSGSRDRDRGSVSLVYQKSDHERGWPRLDWPHPDPDFCFNDSKDAPGQRGTKENRQGAKISVERNKHSRKQKQKKCCMKTREKIVAYFIPTGT